MNETGNESPGATLTAGAQVGPPAAPANKPEKSLEGIGGWLYMPLLGLIVTPFRLGWTLFNDFWPIYTEGYWEVLTTPGSEAYHPLWAPLLVFEAAGNVGFIVAALALVWLFLRKSRHVPRWMIIFLAANLAYVGGDFFPADLIPAVAEQNNSDSLKEVLRGAVAMVIWVPYFIFSKRVRRTFVH